MMSGDCTAALGGDEPVRVEVVVRVRSEGAELVLV